MPTGSPQHSRSWATRLNVRDSNHGLIWSHAVRRAARRLRSVDGRRPGQPETADVDWRLPRDGPQRRDAGPQHRSRSAAVLVRSCGQPGSDAPGRPACHVRRHRCTSIRFSRLFTHVDAADPRAILDRRPRYWRAIFPAVLQALDPSGEVRQRVLERGFHRRDGRCPVRRPPPDSSSAARPTRPEAPRWPCSTARRAGRRRQLTPPIGARAAPPGPRCTTSSFPALASRRNWDRTLKSFEILAASGRDDPGQGRAGRRPHAGGISRVGVLHPGFRVQNRPTAS